MRDHEPNNHAAFDDSLGGSRPSLHSSCDDHEMESKYERPSMRNLDIHERPTLVP